MQGARCKVQGARCKMESEAILLCLSFRVFQIGENVIGPCG